MSNIEEFFVTLARLSLSGREQDVHVLLRRIARRYSTELPELASAISDLIKTMPTQAMPLRGGAIEGIPVDQDSNLRLLRVEHSPNPEPEPIWPESVETALRQFVRERHRQQELILAGLSPSKSLLLKGPPGVGKTLAASWIARELGVPLLTLDLSAVMSSYLGRTGKNIRHVLEYAKSVQSVLLLDEIDAIAKRRDDAGELGELKRLVTVLLQEIDDWPEHGVLLAATNHEELLDPAAFRRFDRIIDFPLPDMSERRALIEQLLVDANVDATILSLVSATLNKASFSDVARFVSHAHRQAVLESSEIETILIEALQSLGNKMTNEQKRALAKTLHLTGLNHSEISRLTGISRDTVRKAVSKR